MRPELVEGDEAIAILVRTLELRLELRKLIHLIGRQLTVAILVHAFEHITQHRVFLGINAKREARQDDREKMNA